MSNPLAELQARLDQHGATIPQELAASWLRQTALSAEDVEPYVSFRPDLYQRTTVCRTEHYELLVVSWGRGQWSTIHDHVGSICAFRVVRGRATEIHFQLSSAGYIFPAETVVHSPGEVQSCCGGDMHQLCNLEEEGLVSVHVYSPPLSRSVTYSLEDSPFHDYAALSQRVARRAAGLATV